MSNLEQLIEWMKEELKAENDLSDTSIGYRMALRDCVVKAKQLQKEEPKTYTQEDLDKAISKAWKQGHEEGYDLAYDKYKFPYKD